MRTDAQGRRRAIDDIRIVADAARIVPGKQHPLQGVAVSGVLHWLLIYLKYSVAVVAIGTVLAGGMWLWLALKQWLGVARRS